MFTEGSFVLVDGDFGYDSVFKVAEIGHPPSERRDEAMYVRAPGSLEHGRDFLTTTSCRKIHGHHDFLGVGVVSAAEEVHIPSLVSSGGHRVGTDPEFRVILQADLIAAEQSPNHETSFILLSDLHLDNPRVMNALGEVLSAYNDMDENSVPKLFVLCGNFRSRPWLFNGEAMRDYTGKSLDPLFLFQARSPHLTDLLENKAQTSLLLLRASSHRSKRSSPTLISCSFPARPTPGLPPLCLAPLSRPPSSRP